MKPGNGRLTAAFRPGTTNPTPVEAREGQTEPGHLNAPLIEFTVPIRTANPLNNSWGGWEANAGKRKSQRRAVALRFPPVELRPVFVVTMTRVSAGTLDDDGLRASLKSVRDAVAERLGVDDRPGGLAKWEYLQERGEPKKQAVRVRIEVIPLWPGSDTR